MKLDDQFKQIFSQIADLKGATGLADQAIGAMVKEIVQGKKPAGDLTADQLDSVYRLAWVGFVRPMVRDQTGFVTSAMQWDIIQSGAMTIDELEADCLGIEQYSAAFLRPAHDLGLMTETSGNALFEVLAFSGPDLRVLVQLPLMDFRQPVTQEELDANDDWNAASERARNLLLRGDLAHDFLPPEDDQQFIFRFRQALDLRIPNAASEILAIALEKEITLDPRIMALANAMVSGMFGEFGLANAAIQATSLENVDDTTIDFALEAAYVLQTSGDQETAMQIFAALPISSDPKLAMRTLYELALAQSQIERYDEALVNINRAVEFQPDNAMCHTMRGFILNRLEKTDEALEEYARALELDSFDTTALNNRGEIFYERGEYEEALKTFEEVLGLEEKFRSRFFQTKTLLAMGRHQDALDQTRIMLGSFPADREILLMQADAYEELGIDAGAISARVATLRYSVALDEFALEARDSLRRMRYTLPSESDDNPWPRDEYQMNWAAEFSPEDAEMIDNYAFEVNDHLQAGHADLATEAVADFFAEVESLAVKTHYTFLKRAQIKVAEGDFEGAIEDSKQAIEIEPRDRFGYLTASDGYKGLEQYPEAIEMMKLGLEIYPHAPEYWYQLNYLYEANGQFEESLSAADRGLEIDPGHQDMLYNRARLLTELERYEESIAQYSMLLTLFPDDAEAALNLGVAYLQSQDSAKAIEAFERAIEIRPDYPFAFQKLALTREDHAKASVDFAIAVALLGIENTQEVFLGMMASQQELLKEENITVDQAYLADRLTTLNTTIGAWAALDSLVYLEGVLGDSADYWLLRASHADQMYSDEGDAESQRCIERANEIAPSHPANLLRSLETVEGPDAVALAQKILGEIDQFDDVLSFDALSQIPYTLSDVSDDHETNAALMSACRENFQRRFPDQTDAYELTLILFKLALETDLAGDQEGSIALYTELIERDPNESTYLFNRACEHAFLGRADAAVDDLRKAIEMNDDWRESAQSDAYFDPIREHADFVALVTG